MLTMVTVQRTEPHGMGQKLLEILRPAKVVEQIETGAGREYRHITVEVGRKDIPWKKVDHLDIPHGGAPVGLGETDAAQGQHCGHRPVRRGLGEEEEIVVLVGEVG